MNGFRHTDRSKVAVTLIGENNVFGVGALNAGCNGGCSSVSGFDHIKREIIVRHNRAADRSNTDCLALDSKLVYDLGDKAMNDTVRTAGAVMKRHINK